MIYKYFSAGNTPRGFVNYFGDAMNFDDASQILYIKGGSGIGKSTLMKKVSNRAIGNGRDVTHIHCSSDKNSLDGVVIDGRIALFDATMPHISDPLYPRVNGKIVDLGVALDESKLTPKKTEIISLVKAKKECYKNVYSLLSTLLSVNEALYMTLDIDDIALCRVAREVAECIVGEDTRATRGFVSLIDSAGLLDMTGGIIDDRRVYAITSEIDDVSLRVVDMVSHIIYPTRHAHYYSILEPNRVETLGTSNSIVTRSPSTRRDIIYNIDSSVNIKNKHAYDILKTYRDDIVIEASHLIGEAQSHHMELEEIYRSAIDYDMLTTIQNKLTDELLEY